MPILETDIKILKSARMTDTPDGGGRMTGTVVQSGVDNNVFDDVSGLDRVHGSASLRKLFGGVFTNSTDKYLGARAILDEAPEDDNVHVLLFAASSLFDTRSQTRVKVESYLAPGAFYPGQLFGNHLGGMSTVTLIQQQDRVVPSIGTVLLLRKNEGLANEVDQYVRITAVSSSVQTFTDGEGDFTRRVVVCSLSDPLREAFNGFQAGRVDTDLNFVGLTRVFTTVVADASQYYGIRPLQVAAVSGAYSIKADTVFSPLLPSAQIETPIADARTNGTTATMMAAGEPLQQTVTATFGPSQKLFIGGGVLPNTLQMANASGNTATDVGGVLMYAGEQVGTVDHANGIVAFTVPMWGGLSTITVRYLPAVQVASTEQSLSIPISINNRSLSYVVTLRPIPTAGTLRVSYLSGGNWYVLDDDLTGAVKGADSALGAGSLNYSTGTLSVTLGALPDVGSALLLQWVETPLNVVLRAANLSVGGKLYFAINSDGAATEERGSKALTPGSVTLSWNDGAARTATDNGLGVLTGAATGTVDYAQGVVRLAFNTLPPLNTTVVLDSTRRTKATATGVNVNGGVVAPNVQPRTVSFDLNITVLHAAVADGTTLPQSTEGTPITKAVRVVDDGLGNLFFTDGVNGNQVVGTINYTTGVITIATGVNNTAGTYDMEGATVTYLGTSGTSSDPAPTSSGGSSGGSYSYSPSSSFTGFTYPVAISTR